MRSDPGCSGTEASRSARPSPFTKPRGAGSPFQPVLFGHTSYPGRGTDPHPRQPRPRTSSRGNRRAGPGNRAGSRRGPKAAKEEAAPGAAMAEGRGSSRLYSLRLISLGLRLTASLPGELQNSRAGAGYPAPARPDHPRRAPTSAPPSGSRASRACALAPPTAAPPSSCPDSERPASLLGGHVDPGWGGGRGCASPLPGAVTPEESASRSPSACARASRSQSALAPQSHPAVGRGWTGCYPRPDQRSGSRTFSPVLPHQLSTGPGTQYTV